jgi:hypothetical protein
MQDNLYRVAWEIDMAADSPQEAIKKAMSYLAPLEPARWCYSVRNHENGKESRHEGEELFA